eukprot:scaffold84722_cov27-Tisochrysis_lutea.AAC.2
MAATSALTTQTISRPAESPVTMCSLFSATAKAVSDSEGAQQPRTANACPVPSPKGRTFHTRKQPSAPHETSVGASASACAFGSRNARHSIDSSAAADSRLPLPTPPFEPCGEASPSVPRARG